MNTLLEILFIPGAMIGGLLLRISCWLGINSERICIYDNGSGTSTGEHMFMRVGNIIFYGIVLLLIILYVKKRKVKNDVR